jgi:hypothetical protein
MSDMCRIRGEMSTLIGKLSELQKQEEAPKEAKRLLEKEQKICSSPVDREPGRAGDKAEAGATGAEFAVFFPPTNEDKSPEYSDSSSADSEYLEPPKKGKNPRCTKRSRVTIMGRKCALCASDLEQKDDEIIWIRVGKTDHPSYEMIRRGNTCTIHPSDPVNMMWVKWQNTGTIEGVSRHQIVEDGLQPRQRKQPKFYSEK